MERPRAEMKFVGEYFVVERRIAIEPSCSVEGQTVRAEDVVGG